MRSPFLAAETAWNVLQARIVIERLAARMTTTVKGKNDGKQTDT
jgi:hypothetical protein